MVDNSKLLGLLNYVNCVIFSEREWTEEDDQRLQALYNAEGPSWQKIAIPLRRNRFQVQTRYQRFICGEKAKQVPVQGKTKLLYIKDDDNLRGVIYGKIFNYIVCLIILYIYKILEYAKDLIPVHPIVLVTRGVGEKEDQQINWQKLCRKYSNLNVIKCQNEWYIIFYSL